MGRLSQIQRLRWREVDLRIGAIEWGVEEDARKSPAARRVVPTVKPLLTLLKRTWIKQGRPDGEDLVCPPRRPRPDALLHSGGLSARANDRWEESGREPIGLHECRHTAATWLDAVGVSPKVASVLMGHAIPDHQPGAASITLARYTHMLPGVIETARDQLDAWLAAELAKGRKSGELHRVPPVLTIPDAQPSSRSVSRCVYAGRTLRGRCLGQLVAVTLPKET